MPSNIDDKPKKESKGRKDLFQTGWRLNKNDQRLLDGLDEYARAHRLSRNSAITVSVEKMIKDWQKERINEARLMKLV